MGKYKAAIFDVDGTLLFTRPGILKAVRDTLKELGYRDLDPDEEYMFCGPPIQKSMMTTYGITKEQAQEYANAFRKRYSSHEYLFDAKAYEGILNLLADLRDNGIKIAVATYKREDYAIDIVNHFGVGDFSDVTHGADNFNKLTKSDIINLCISEMGLTAEECVMIGDSDNDAIGAEGIGCPFIGVTYGFGFTCTEDVNKFPNIGVANTPEEIFKYFV